MEPGLIYGQVKKSYHGRKLVRVTHVMRLGTEDALKAALQGLGFTGRLNTSFIERVNLTVRNAGGSSRPPHVGDGSAVPTPVGPLGVVASVLSFRAPHQSLRMVLVQPRERGDRLPAQLYRQRTPAMAAGRTTRRWTAREVLIYPLPKDSA